MKTKKCFKCGKELPLTEFYKHKGMSDGHLNKCKECTKQDTHTNYQEKLKNIEWVDKQRARGRDKYLRLYKPDYLRNKCDFGQIYEKIISNNNANRDLKKRGYITEGKEAHHWNYNEPKQVFLLSVEAHHKIHQFTIVNYEDGFCYTLNGDKLDNIKKATKHFKQILEKFNINEELILIDYS